MLNASKSSHTNFLNRGADAEEFVAQWLMQQGFKILQRNYRKKFGEIDIIASCLEVVAFVEVKMRSNHYFNLSQVIIPSKQKKIIRVAQTYIAHNQLHDKIFRFDVALVEQQHNRYELTYIPNAFTQPE